MDLENCEFKDAIEILSNLTGIPIQGNFKQENFEEKKSMYALYKDAVQYYKEALSRYPEIKKYLFERGLSEDSIRNFHFGYADSGLNLYNHLKEKKYDDDIIGESGIFLDIKSKKDKFINRIIFPIQNARGDFVALAGRIIGSGEPKYLNSPASKIYDKSAILYGLYNARSAITKTGFVIVTEGYMDTISLQEGGFPNTVCVSGTALTEKHIQMIKRLTHKIYLCFDNDGAGQKATKLSLELLKNTGIEVKIIHLKGGKDPDEILKKEGEKGKEVFERLIDTAETPIAYYLRNSDFKTESIEDKRKTLTPILEMIAHYSDSIEQDSYLKETARLLNIHLNVVYDAFNKIRLKRENPIQTPNIKKDFSLEETIIANILSNESLREEIEKGCIFPIDPESDLGHFLKEGKDYLDHMELSKKERYKALVLKIEQLQ
ncbi:MAG: DNA primase [Candidatus Peribacteria bacterium]|nr:MAG: DNA primase [Candidatus Peribacteria bacterium]